VRCWQLGHLPACVPPPHPAAASAPPAWLSPAAAAPLCPAASQPGNEGQARDKHITHFGAKAASWWKHCCRQDIPTCGMAAAAPAPAAAPTPDAGGVAHQADVLLNRTLLGRQLRFPGVQLPQTPLKLCLPGSHLLALGLPLPAGSQTRAGMQEERVDTPEGPACQLPGGAQAWKERRRESNQLAGECNS
jgi:hypothetical protein